MNRPTLMTRLLGWHVWLGWLVGVPLLLWTLSGLAMVLRPMEEVRGEQLRVQTEQKLPKGLRIVTPRRTGGPYTALRVEMQLGKPVVLVEKPGGAVLRFGIDGNHQPLVTQDQVREIVAEGTVGGDRVTSIRRFGYREAPLDYRKNFGVWQVALADGTHVYVRGDSGEIDAIRTRWWRFYDFMWGMHIMDLQGREDTHHPVLILFAALALAGSALGMALLFRRRRMPGDIAR